MADIKSKLARIFDIEDPQKRVETLLEYGRQLKINLVKAKSPDCTYSENELAVLIFNAENNRRMLRLSNIGVFAVALFFFVMILAGIFLVYYISVSASKMELGEQANQVENVR